MMRYIHINANRLRDRESAYAYMKEIFALPDHMGKNLDAMFDVLSEVSEEATFLLSPTCMKEVCAEAYSFQFLRMLGRAVDENPHLHIRFDFDTKKE